MFDYDFYGPSESDYDTDYVGYADYDYEDDLDFGYETDSALASAGWGTDEDYGYYGDEDAAMEYGLWGAEA